MIKVALICGTGASSSFMAVKLRQAVRNRELHIDVVVCPETDLSTEIESYDCLLIGPHLSFLEEELPEKFTLQGRLYVIPNDIYAAMDGNRLLEFILEKQPTVT